MTDRFQNDWTKKIEQLEARVEWLEGYKTCWELLLPILTSELYKIYPDVVRHIETEMEDIRKTVFGR